MEKRFTTSSFPLSAIKEMEIRASKLTDVVSLAQGKSFFPTPDPIREAAIASLSTKRSDPYSQTYGLIELRQAVHSYIFDTSHRTYNPESEIIITAGANQALFVSLATLCCRGDEFLVFTPSFATYARLVTLLGGKPVFIPLHENRSWHPSLQEIEKNITKKTKGIIICNPNNPTGTAFSHDEMSFLVKLAEKHHIFLLCDEVYYDFVYDGRQPLSILSFATPKNRAYLLQIFSFSKLFSMCGMRLGYVAGDQSVIKEIIKTHDTNIVCAPTVSQYAGYEALISCRSYTQTFKQEYIKRRALLTKRIEPLSDFFEYQSPQGTFYAFPRLKKEKNSLHFCLEVLEQARVALVPGSTFGPTGEAHVRIAFASTEGVINRAFDRIEVHLKRKTRKTL